MAKVLYTESYIADIGSAIREKNGTTRQYKTSEMADAVRDLVTKNDLYISGKTFTSNGTYTPNSFGYDYFSGIIVSVPDSGGQDTSDATLSSGGQMLSGVTAYARGSKYTGTIPTYTGMVNSSAGSIGSYPIYSGAYSVNPTSAVQTLHTANMIMVSDVTIGSASGGGQSLPYYTGSYVVTPMSQSQTFQTSGKAMSSNFIVEAYSASEAPSAVLSPITIRAEGTYTASSLGVDGFSEVVIDLAGIPPGTGYFIETGSGTLYASLISNKSAVYLSFPNYTTVWSSAFSDCSNLVTVYFDNVTSMKTDIFEGCSTIRSCFIMTSSVFTGEDNGYGQAVLIFRDSPLFEHSNSDFSARGSIYVPTSLYSDYMSLDFWKYMFPRMVSYPTDYLGSFVIPSSAYYYYREEAPENVDYPRVTIVGKYAYSNCSVRSISLPICSTIEAYAFAQCPISSLYLPSCTNISGYAFASNSNLTSVSLPVCTIIGSGAFSRCNITGSLYLPSCEVVYNGAFNDCSLITELNAPVCERIENYAFYNCYSLSRVYTPLCSLIGVDAFEDDLLLEDVYMPLCKTISGGAFISCSALRSVSFPLCETIYGGAFEFCRMLDKVDFPSCTSVGSHAFWKCTNVSYVNLPKCSYIGEGAFEFCTNITEVNLLSCRSIGGQWAFEGCSKLESITLPLCSVIPFACFRWCSVLTYASLNACKEIHEDAFEYCSNLTTIYAPLCETISEWAFYGCGKISDVYMPNLKFISDRGFFAEKLPYIDFPLLEEVGKSVFNLNPASYISLPKLSKTNGVTFAGCSLATTVYLPALEEIYQGNFNDFFALTTLILSNCYYIYDNFNDCTNFSSLYLYGRKPWLRASSPFSNTPFSLNDSAYAKIYVLSSLYNAYLEDSNWGNFSNCLVSM